MPPYICNSGLYGFQKDFPCSILLGWHILSPGKFYSCEQFVIQFSFHLLKLFTSCTGDLYLKKYSGTLRLGRRKTGKSETIETSFLAFLYSSVTWGLEL